MLFFYFCFNSESWHLQLYKYDVKSMPGISWKTSGTAGLNTVTSKVQLSVCSIFILAIFLHIIYYLDNIVILIDFIITSASCQKPLMVCSAFISVDHSFFLPHNIHSECAHMSDGKIFKIDFKFHRSISKEFVFNY